MLGVNILCGKFYGCYSGGFILDSYYLVAQDDTINKTWCGQ